MFEFIFPKLCVGCGKIGFIVCEKCEKTLLRSSSKCFYCKIPSLKGICPECQKKHYPDAVLSVYKFKGLIRELVHELKFSDVASYSEYCAKAIGDLLIEKLEIKNDWVISAIPIHRKKMNFRGYNQSELIAKHLAKNLYLKYEPLLKKVIDNQPQSSLHTPSERKENVKGSFIAGKIDLPETVILIDDVVTSGSTFMEASKVLKKAGVKKVFCVALCRG